MKASSWLPTLPSGPGQVREAAIFEAIVNGDFLPVVWRPITSSANGHTATIWVAEDALQVGEPGDSTRVTVTHRTAQQIADYFDARLPTTKISDLAWQQAAVRVPAMPQNWWQDGSMSFTSRMAEYSAMVDGQVTHRDGLAADVGKDWVLTAKLAGHPDTAANYGFRKPDGAPWQTLGLAHNLEHTDYAQPTRLVSKVVMVDGVKMLLDDVLTNPELAALVSSEGPLPFVRHPGVPYSAPGNPLSDPTGSVGIMEKAVLAAGLIALLWMLYRSVSGA